MRALCYPPTVAFAAVSNFRRCRSGREADADLSLARAVVSLARYSAMCLPRARARRGARAVVFLVKHLAQSRDDRDEPRGSQSARVSFRGSRASDAKIAVVLVKTLEI